MQLSSFSIVFVKIMMNRGSLTLRHSLVHDVMSPRQPYTKHRTYSGYLPDAPRRSVSVTHISCTVCKDYSYASFMLPKVAVKGYQLDRLC